MKLPNSEFFDIHPVLYPWPKVLRKKGYSIVFKPRDAKFKHVIGKLKFIKNQKVLDVGSGDGVFLDRLVKTFKVKGTGVDISEASIRRAKKDSLKSIKFLKSSAAKLPFKDGYFDTVLSFDTLEHIKDQKTAVEEMVRVLKPKGTLVIYTINKNHKFTPNWILFNLGFDVYEAYDHDPKLFSDPVSLGRDLKKRGLIVNKSELFNCFFTLWADELVMGFTYLFNRSGLIKRDSKASNCLGNIVLAFLNLFSEATLPILEFLDSPWKIAGYSNSFFIIARKNGK